VVLTVTDTGHGMDEATKSRIFVPFFTTKEVGKGTGLGLCMAREVIQKSRGAITVDSERGRGTSFRICLPRVAGEAEAALTNLALSIGRASRGGSETILAVEDDDAVRELAREILEPAGYRVWLAHDGVEALRAAQEEANEIHLLMTDVAMPNMRGTDLAARLAGSRPGMKVLYVSGYSNRAAAGEEPLERGGTYLEKPFTPDTLLQSVREILDAPPEVNILVVDDDPAIRSFLRHVLRSSGHRVLEASNGRQAVQHLRQRKVDLLITDLIMPDQEGLETIQTAREEFPDLQVVAMSGGFGEQFLIVAEKLGAQEILHKPFGAEAVRELVRRLFATRTNKPA
jgi:DNA-binding NtrC family response regulator